ncbi:hypothetical protein D3C73_1467480 [compost metagenome]
MRLSLETMQAAVGLLLVISGLVSVALGFDWGDRSELVQAWAVTMIGFFLLFDRLLLGEKKR